MQLGCTGRRGLLKILIQNAASLCLGNLLRRSSNKREMHDVRLAWLSVATSGLDRSRDGNRLSVSELA